MDVYCLGLKAFKQLGPVNLSSVNEARSGAATGVARLDASGTPRIRAPHARVRQAPVAGQAVAEIQIACPCPYGKLRQRAQPTTHSSAGLEKERPRGG